MKRTLAGAWTAALFALASLAGCQTPPPAAPQQELSFAEQVRRVQSGASDRIQLEQAAVSDADLAALSDLPALRELLIDDERSRVTARGLVHLAGLAQLEHLRVRGPGIDDDAVLAMSRLPALRILNVPRGTFTDEGLKALAAHPRLAQLRFGSPHVTDAGMQSLAAMPALRHVHLLDVPITEAGLATLAGKRSLTGLYLDDIDLPDAAWDRLFADRPDLHLHLNQDHHDRDPHPHDHAP